MKAGPIMAIALAFGLAFAMLAGAGWTAQTGGSDGGIVTDEVEDTANNSPVDIEGSAQNQNDGDVIGFIVNSGDKIIDFVLLGLTIGSALGSLGFPGWFTKPVGWAIQLTLMVGFAQYVVNRRLK